MPVIRKLFFILSIFGVMGLFTSCLTIERPDDMFTESEVVSLEAKLVENIFKNYLWTTPPIGSVELVFDENSRAALNFRGKKYELELKKDATLLVNQPDGEQFLYRLIRSANDMYYNVNVLGTKTVPRQMLVTRTRWVTRTVPVTRSVPVTRTRMVTVSNFDGSFSTRTETYTDYEMRTEYESRTVPETYTEWVTVQVEVYDIPEYNYYHIDAGDFDLALYSIKDEAGINRFFYQNISFVKVDHVKEGKFTVDEVTILGIDSNANGYYFEQDDRVLFNVWNPYDPDSEFREIPTYLDNYWYTLRELYTNKFISMRLRAKAEGYSLEIDNANSPFVDSEERGMLYVNNIPDDAYLYVNGYYYFANRKGEFKRKIEYGLHKVVIEHEERVNYEEVIVVDENNPEVTINYELPALAGTFEFDNDYLKNWTIIFDNGVDAPLFFYNTKLVNLAEGDYELTIMSGGYSLKREISVEVGETIYFDYKKELSKERVK